MVKISTAAKILKPLPFTIVNTAYDNLIPQWIKPCTPVRQMNTTVSVAVFLRIQHTCIFFKMGKILCMEVLDLD